jgi:uncharacterized protein with FMN-binding domain
MRVVHGGMVAFGTLITLGVSGCGSSSSTPPTAPPTSPPVSAGGTHKYQGPIVQMQWGPVQATIFVKNGKITDSSLGAAPENPRSQFIDTQAAPILHQETLATTDGNINEVSGASDTSGAYIESLQAAIKAWRG